jgi:hypothetical protein
MNVELPDGTVVTDIPDGTTKQQLIDKLARNGYDTRKLGMTSEAAAYQGGATPPQAIREFVGGAKHALDRAAIGVKGLLPESVQRAGDWVDEKVTGRKVMTPELIRQGEAFVKETGPASTVGQVAGDVALSAAPVARLTKALQAARLAAPVAGIGANAAYSAATAPENRGEAALWGGGGAAGGQVLSRALARVAQPYTAGQGTKTLLDAGITPTLGDAMTADARKLAPLVRAGERGVEAVPLAGSMLRATREKALKDFQQATREAALPPGATPTEATSVDALAKAFKTAYDDVLDIPFPMRAVEDWDPERAAQSLSMNLQLDPGKANRVAAYVHNVFDGIDFAERPTAAAAHNAESILKRKAFQYKKSLDPDQQAYGELLYEVAKDWGNAWRGELPAKTSALVSQIDAQYAKFVPVRRAAGLAANVADPEAYTPKHLLQSIRAGDKSPTKTRFLAGQMPQQDLATAAAALSPARDPDLFSKFLTTGALASPLVGLTVPAVGGMVGAGAYALPVVQKYLIGAYSPRQQIASSAMRRAAPTAAKFGRAGAEQERQRQERVLRQARLLQALNDDEERRRRIVEQAEALQR